MIMVACDRGQRVFKKLILKSMWGPTIGGELGGLNDFFGVVSYLLGPILSLGRSRVLVDLPRGWGRAPRGGADRRG